MKAQSQNKAVLDHLRRGHRITALDALGLFGCDRLAARVHDLKNLGVKIEKEMVKVPSGKYVALYSLDNEA